MIHPMNYGIQHEDPINPLERLVTEEFLSRDYKCVYFQIRLVEPY